MAVLKNAKHELFAQELAKGRTQVEAYAAAGYAGDFTAASRLSSHVKVSARVAELLAKAAVRTEITVAGITERMLRLATKAEDLGDASGFQASRASLMDAAKLNGLVVEKAEANGTLNINIRRFSPEPDAG